MTSHLAPGGPVCPDCFRCECGRVVCGLSEDVFCAHSDEPTCPDCCETYHGGAA